MFNQSVIKAMLCYVSRLIQLHYFHYIMLNKLIVEYQSEKHILGYFIAKIGV